MPKSKSVTARNFSYWRNRAMCSAALIYLNVPASVPIMIHPANLVRHDSDIHVKTGMGSVRVNGVLSAVPVRCDLV